MIMMALLGEDISDAKITNKNETIPKFKGIVSFSYL